MRKLFLFLSFILITPLSGQKACDQITDEPFPEEIVVKVLEEYQVNPREWNSINIKLQRKLRDFDTRVKVKAAQLERNPYDKPVQLLVITRLKRDVLIQIFTDTLKEHGVDDIKKANEMYDAILNEKAQKVWNCYYNN